jgi:hypothetical protein
MRRVSVYSVLFGLVALGLCLPAHAQQCPAGCYYNQTPMAGHGPAPDGSGRRVINIYVNSTFGSNATNVSSAANSAAAVWNAAKDQYGNTTGYYFQVTTDVTKADITITQGDPQTGPACGNIGTTLRNMTLSPTAVGTALANLAAIIDHEIGHAIGLADSPSPACSNTPDIMYGYTGACQQIYTTTSTQDVALSNQNLNASQRGSCTQDVNQTTGDPPEPSPTPTPTCSGNPSLTCPPGANVVCNQNGIWACSDGSPGCANPPPMFECPDGAEQICSYSGVWACSDGSPGCSYPPPEWLNSCQFGDICTQEGWECQPESPIIIDTAGEGFHLTDVAHGVQFALLPGKPAQVAWTDPNFSNGFLALDRNGDGLINDGTELFGNMTPQPPSKSPNGYLALAVFDDPANGGNGNGFIDPGDAVYAKLRVWIDANHNGVSEPAELHTLRELGIVRIDLKYRLSPYVDQFGNRFRYAARIWDEAGKAHGICYDVFLRTGAASTTQ